MNQIDVKAQNRTLMEKVFNEAWQYVHQYDHEVAELGFVQGIDEIAIMFESHLAMNNFISRAVQQEGCIFFNSATDHVHTLPLKTCYDVQYNFLTLPPMDGEDAGRSVRLECMVLGTGLSPLHNMIAFNQALEDTPFTFVHASFKTPDQEDYATAVHRLREGDWEAVQRCESTYGRFSYWQPLDDALHGDLYLKPRVNLRDEPKHDL